MKNFPLTVTADYDMHTIDFKTVLSGISAVELAQMLISVPLLELRKRKKN